MSYDTILAERVRALLAERTAAVEKGMFGGLAFLVAGRMCCGVLKEDLMVRLGPERYDEALWEPHVRAMDFTGRPMIGYVYVAPQGLQTTEALRRWLELAVEFVSSLSERGAEAGRTTDARAKTQAKTTTKAKPTAKKPASKKPASKKPASKKPASKKPPAKKPAAKKPAAKKAAKSSPKRRR